MIETVTLEEIGEWGSGGTPLASTLEYYNGGIPWLIIEDLNDGLVTSSKRCITEAGLKNSSAKIVDPGTLLIAMYGSIGKLGISGIRCATNQAIAFCKCDSQKIDVKFLFYSLLSSRETLLGRGRGGTQQNINQEILKNYSISLPPLDEQRRIAHRLDRADHLRRARRYALQLSDTFLQSVFLEMFGDPVSNPQRWEIEELESILETQPQNGLYLPKENYTTDESGIEMVHMGDLFYGIVLRGNLKRVILSESQLERYCLDENDLLIARRSLNFDGAGKPCQIPRSSNPLVFESSMIRIRPNRQKILPDYLYNYLAHPEVKKAHIMKYITVSTISGINQIGLKAIKVLLPPLQIQQEYVAIVRRVERLRRQQTEALRQADALFQRLLHDAFPPPSEENAPERKSDPVLPLWS